MKRLMIAAFLIFNVSCLAQSATLPTEATTPLIIPTFPKETPRPTSTPIVASPTPVFSEDLFYTVQAGDTLTQIAEQVGLSVTHLISINRLQNPDWIYEGQVLMLKSGGEIQHYAYEEEGKKVIVVLSEQKVYAVDGSNVIEEFLVSTGVPRHPTVIGRYSIYVKLESTRMSGGQGVEYYDLSNVPWTMYFYKGYGLHGTWWHNNFGTPMSHGCVNMFTPDAEWLFDWVEVGTPVWVIE